MAAAQYFAPVMLTLSLLCLLKTTGAYCWLTPFNFMPDLRIPTLVAMASSKFNRSKSLHSKKTTQRTCPGDNSAQAMLASSVLHLTHLINPLVCRAVFSLMLVGVNLITVTLSLLGLGYNTRFTPQTSA